MFCYIRTLHMAFSTTLRVACVQAGLSPELLGACGIPCPPCHARTTQQPLRQVPFLPTERRSAFFAVPPPLHDAGTTRAHLSSVCHSSHLKWPQALRCSQVTQTAKPPAHAPIVHSRCAADAPSVARPQGSPPPPQLKRVIPPHHTTTTHLTHTPAQLELEALSILLSP